MTLPIFRSRSFGVVEKIFAGVTRALPCRKIIVHGLIPLTIGVLLVLPSLTAAQGFGQGLVQGLNQGSQYALQRQQLALQYQQMKLQQLEQRRALRRQELEGEVTQWARTVQQWRDLTGQPRMTENELFTALDRLRVFDWERQDEQAWLQQ